MRAILLLMATALAAGAADREFNEIVQAISYRYHHTPDPHPALRPGERLYVRGPAGRHEPH